MGACPGGFSCSGPTGCYTSCFATDGVTPDSSRCAAGLTCESDGTCDSGGGGGAGGSG